MDAVHSAERRRVQNVYYVYILLCSNKKTYVGCTTDIDRRLVDHNSGKIPYTQPLRPVILLSYFAITDKYRAFEFEKYLKSGSGRAFMAKHLLPK